MKETIISKSKTLLAMLFLAVATGTLFTSCLDEDVPMSIPEEAKEIINIYYGKMNVKYGDVDEERDGAIQIYTGSTEQHNAVAISPFPLAEILKEALDLDATSEFYKTLNKTTFYINYGVSRITDNRIELNIKSVTSESKINVSGDEQHDIKLSFDAYGDAYYNKADHTMTLGIAVSKLAIDNKYVEDFKNAYITISGMKPYTVAK